MGGGGETTESLTILVINLGATASVVAFVTGFSGKCDSIIFFKEHRLPSKNLHAFLNILSHTQNDSVHGSLLRNRSLLVDSNVCLDLRWSIKVGHRSDIGSVKDEFFKLESVQIWATKSN